MTEQLKKPETKNPFIQEQIIVYIEQIFQAAVIYHKFEENFQKMIKEKKTDENEKIYMISKNFLDNFKEKIKYNEIKDLFVDANNEKNLDKFKEKLMNYGLEELEFIIYGEFNMYGDLENIEDNLETGFDFVNWEFLEKLDFEFQENMNESNINYYKENNNVFIVFSDKSKLLISEQNGEKKYYAIPSPIIEYKGTKQIKKLKTFSMTNRNKIKGIK